VCKIHKIHQFLIYRLTFFTRRRSHVSSLSNTIPLVRTLKS
jgi:hypothetical protein